MDVDDKTAVKLRFWCHGQPFRTKWTLDVKNWSKIAILVSRAQPFRTNGRWTSKTEKKNAILLGPSRPFRKMDVERQKLR